MRLARWNRPKPWAGAILELCVAVGGTITGEHGVGREKINQMCVQFSIAEIETFAAMKAAFDPTGLLNPGKAIPDPGPVRRVRRHACSCRCGSPLLTSTVSRCGDQSRRPGRAGSRGFGRRHATSAIIGGDTKAFYGRARERRAARHSPATPGSSTMNPANW